MEPMTLGSPSSPSAATASNYLPSFLMGEPNAMTAPRTNTLSPTKGRTLAFCKAVDKILPILIAFENDLLWKLIWLMTFQLPHRQPRQLALPVILIDRCFHSGVYSDQIIKLHRHTTTIQMCHRWATIQLQLDHRHRFEMFIKIFNFEYFLNQFIFRAYLIHWELNKIQSWIVRTVKN